MFISADDWRLQCGYVTASTPQISPKERNLMRKMFECKIDSETFVEESTPAGTAI